MRTLIASVVGVVGFLIGSHRSACRAGLVLLALGCGQPPVIPVEPAIVELPSPAQTLLVASEPEPFEMPFVTGQRWSGTYRCPQGDTALVIQVGEVQGFKVRATFAFVHEASGARGEYELWGSFAPRARSIVFAPGRWIVQPPNYVTVGMEGRVSSSGKVFSGAITHPSCGAFSVALHDDQVK